MQSFVGFGSSVPASHNNFYRSCQLSDFYLWLIMFFSSEFSYYQYQWWIINLTRAWLQKYSSFSIRLLIYLITLLFFLKLTVVGFRGKWKGTITQGDHQSSSKCLLQVRIRDEHWSFEITSCWIHIKRDNLKITTLGWEPVSIIVSSSSFGQDP